MQRKIVSTPEIQATLKELKKVLYNDEVLRNAPLHDKAKQTKLQHQKASAKLPVVMVNEVARRKEDCDQSCKIHVVTDHVEGAPEAAQKNKYREHRNDFLKSEVADETVKREIITTPIIKAEKGGLIEKRTTNTAERTPENASNSDKWIVLPKIIIPSRLSRKEIVSAKQIFYLFRDSV